VGEEGDVIGEHAGVVFGVDADADGVVWAEVSGDEAESISGVVVAGRQDLVVDGGAGKGRDDFDRDAAVFLVEPFLGASDVLGVVVATGGVVVRAHVVVDVEAGVLGPAEDAWIVAGDTGGQSGIADHGEGGRDFPGLSLGEKVVHEAAVDVAGQGAPFDGVSNALLDRTELGAGLGEPLDSAAFVPLFHEDAHDVVVGAGDEGIDAERLRFAEDSLDAVEGEVVHHAVVGVASLVREATERITPEDEAGDRQVTDCDAIKGH